MMRKYGSKRASRPYCQTHGAKFCGQCAAYNETPIKTRRAQEKKAAGQAVREQLDLK